MGKKKILCPNLPPPLPPFSLGFVSAFKIPTRVVLLKNMVGPGEVDWELEEEVANECKAKYDPILHVTIFEATESTLPDSEVVKIFVEFEDVQGAMKAHADLNGRFFGGRKVDAAFFNEMSFEQDDLL